MRFWTALLAGSVMLGATAVHAAEPVDPDRIVAAAAGDWNKDELPDLALLVAATEESGEDNAVYIYVANELGKLELKETIANKVWGSFIMAGQQPSLQALGNGSFIIVTHNDSIGRDRWEQRLTVAYRNFEFVVAGYTYTAYDTLEPDAPGMNCDLNVLTGKGKANDKPVAVTPGLVYLRDWDDERGRKACGAQ